ncbi:uncharacterized protein LOC105661753 [Megachile rotundata]|uniref:uncharacterized protein LOC105661753 n=1 Tax=Megachile rotundata TaxID=143995 RepID=UPI0006152AE6|nr:PREDICTED: uncharacterized protein LOC105661753 [Megachile rotundata]
MRRPGTLPNTGTSGHRTAGPIEDGSTPLSIAGDNCSSTGVRLHYSNHSLRRTPQPPPHRDNEGAVDRGQHEATLQNGVPGHHHPPPLPSRHHQSSYPTLPMNGHATHQHHHFPREKDRSSGREKNRDRDAGVQSVPHRSDKHRDVQNDAHDDGLRMGEIGTYRA